MTDIEASGYEQVSKLLSEMFHALVPNGTPSDQFEAKLDYADDLRGRLWEAICAYRDEHLAMQRVWHSINIKELNL